MTKPRKRKIKEVIDEIVDKKRMQQAQEVYRVRSPSVKRPVERVSGPVMPALPDGHIGTASVFYSKAKRRRVTKARN